MLCLLAAVSASPAEPAKELLLYLVEEKTSDGARLIDTPEFPRLGYIAKEPAMRITQLKRVIFNPAPPSINAAAAASGAFNDLTIELVEKDAKPFGKLTLRGATHQNRIALFLDEQFLTAVKVVDPIYEGKINVSSSKEESLRELEKQLKVLVNQ